MQLTIVPTGLNGNAEVPAAILVVLQMYEIICQ